MNEPCLTLAALSEIDIAIIALALGAAGWMIVHFYRNRSR